MNNTKSTSPLLPVLASLLMALPGAAKDPSAGQTLPDPDGKPADVSKPVQVFIIMGQSNTLEFGSPADQLP